MPIDADARLLTSTLKQHLGRECDVQAFEANSWTLRILPKIQSAETPTLTPQANATENLISPLGTTIGAFQPIKGTTMLLMYPAKIASAIARGTGITPRKDLKEVFAKFPAELDIEYNFGVFTIRTFGGTGKLTMRQAADLVFSDMRKQGFSPAPGSEKKIAAFDQFFVPDQHESFWIKNNGIARIELEKRKNGQVRITIHDDQDRSIGPRS